MGFTRILQDNSPLPGPHSRLASTVPPPLVSLPTTIRGPLNSPAPHKEYKTIGLRIKKYYKQQLCLLQGFLCKGRGGVLWDTALSGHNP